MKHEADAVYDCLALKGTKLSIWKYKHSWIHAVYTVWRQPVSLLGSASISSGWGYWRQWWWRVRQSRHDCLLHPSPLTIRQMHIHPYDVHNKLSYRWQRSHRLPQPCQTHNPINYDAYRVCCHVTMIVWNVPFISSTIHKHIYLHILLLPIDNYDRYCMDMWAWYLRILPHLINRKMSQSYEGRHYKTYRIL